MMSQNPDRNAEPRPHARASLHFMAPWETTDKVVHSGSYGECKRLLLSKRRVVQDNCFIMVGDERYSSSDVIKFGTRSDDFMDSA
jgi:hypothetical protein